MPQEAPVDHEINEILAALDRAGTRYNDLKARVDILNAAAVGVATIPPPAAGGTGQQPARD
jgi:hypothetical protein